MSIGRARTEAEPHRAALTDVVVYCLFMHRRLLSRLMPPPLLVKPYMEAPTGYVRPLPDSEKDLPPPKKQRLQSKPKKKKISKKAREFPNRYAPEGVLWGDIVSVVGQDHVDEAIKSENDFNSPYEIGEVFQVEIVSLCNTGEAIGLGFGKRRHPWAIVTRFCFPGETVVVKVYWNRRLHSFAKVLEVVKPDLRPRDDSRIKCKYFGTCGGCQYQVSFILGVSGLRLIARYADVVIRSTAQVEAGCHR